MKNLTKAVIAVMKEVRGMEKNSRVGQGGHAYNGTKDQDVKEVFNEALAKNGLIMFPKDIDEHTQVDRWEEKTNYGVKQKQSVFTKVKVHYTLMHESGEEVTICGYGHGVDPQDKAAGKATTYAMKNALLYTFLTPVGKIDDTETTHSKDIPTPQQMPKQPTKQTVTEGDQTYLKIIKAVVDGKGTIEQAKGKYNISKEVEDSIKEKVASLAQL